MINTKKNNLPRKIAGVLPIFRGIVGGRVGVRDGMCIAFGITS